MPISLNTLTHIAPVNLSTPAITNTSARKRRKLHSPTFIARDFGAKAAALRISLPPIRHQQSCDGAECCRANDVADDSAVEREAGHHDDDSKRHRDVTAC